MGALTGCRGPCRVSRGRPCGEGVGFQQPGAGESGQFPHHRLYLPGQVWRAALVAFQDTGHLFAKGAAAVSRRTHQSPDLHVHGHRTPVERHIGHRSPVIAVDPCRPGTASRTFAKAVGRPRPHHDPTTPRRPHPPPPAATALETPWWRAHSPHTPEHRAVEIIDIPLKCDRANSDTQSGAAMSVAGPATAALSRPVSPRANADLRSTRTC